MPSLLTTVSNKPAVHRQAYRLPLSNYGQSCRTELVAYQQQCQQKNLNRSLFQQHNASDVGDLVYKHKRRFYYLLSYAVVHSALLVSGYLQPPAEVNETSTYLLISTGLIFCTLLYVLSHFVVSRTVIYIYYNEAARRFLGICYNWRMARKNLVFKPGDVQLVGDNPNIMQMLRGIYVIDKQFYHISTGDFRHTRHYNLMLGFVNP